MLIEIPDVLDARDLSEVRRRLDGATFASGSASAGARAARVKNNEEIPLDAAVLEALNRIVMGKLVRNETYRMAALPLKVAAPFYARYGEGMSYGTHLDDPVMGEGARYRSDVSITVFLNGPEEYDGGELCVQTDFGEQPIKLAAGWAILYPSSTVHRVAPVTRGQRLAAVTWVQSMVPGAEKRALLYRLAQARAELMQTRPDERATELVDQAYLNLVRMWSRV